MPMNDSFASYEAALTALLQELRQRNHPRYSEALIYEQRLRENIQQSRWYGDTESSRSIRSEVLARLTELSLDVLNRPFYELGIPDNNRGSPALLLSSPNSQAESAATIPPATPTVYPLHDAALIATFHGQRGMLNALADHLVQQFELSPSNTTTFSNESTETLLLHFDPPAAADTSVIQLALNSNELVVTAWQTLRTRLECVLDATLLHLPVWGYSLVYQAMLSEEPQGTLDSALQATLQALEPVVQRLQPTPGEKLPLLASSTLPGGMVSLHHIPLKNDGWEAANVYVALSLPDPNNQLVRQGLLSRGATLLMPDLIAHKIYHQIRQYRSGGWLNNYNHLVDSLRDDTDMALNSNADDGAYHEHIATLKQKSSAMLSRIQNLKALHISLTQQNENLPWWIEHAPGDKALFQFHQRHGQKAVIDLDLLLKKGQTALDGARTALEHMQQNQASVPTSPQRPSTIATTNEPLQVILRFEPTNRGATITWESRLGTKKSRFVTPYTGEDLRLVIQALDALQYPQHPYAGPTFSAEEQERLKALELWGYKRVSREAPRLVGQKLYNALRKSREGGEALNSVREAARAQGLAIRYILHFPSDAVELAALPWELLWDERQAVLLSRGGPEIDSCERYLDLDMALSPPLPVGKKLHVLALAPHAHSPQQLRDEERAARLKSWRALEEQGLLSWDELSPVTAASLDERMRRGPVPDIVHYYGHGAYTNGQGALLFDAPHTSEPGKLVSAQHLDAPHMVEEGELINMRRLAVMLGGIRLILLCACQSAMVPALGHEESLLTGIAPALSAVAEVVVAMQLSTRGSAATQFSDVFYSELVRGRSVQAAVATARRSLYVTESDGMSWYVPTLYIRTREQRPIYFVQPRRDD